MLHPAGTGKTAECLERERVAQGGGAWQEWCWSQLGQYSWASAGPEPSAWELYLPQRRWCLQPQATAPGARERVGKGGPGGPGVTSGFSSFPDAGPPPEPWQPLEAEPHMGASASACTPMAGEPPLAGPGYSQLGLQPEPSLGALDLSILYKGRTVLQEVVGRPRCVLLYGPSAVAGGAPAPQQVAFPSPAGLPDQKQLHYTEKLLQHVAPGLQLELRGPWLWARRLGKCKVYWEVGGPLGSASTSSPARLLPRDCDTPIFDFGTFFQGQ